MVNKIEGKKYFQIPTEEELKEFIKNQIENANDEELYDLYNETQYNMRNVYKYISKNPYIKYTKTDIYNSYKDEKQKIICEMKKRKLKIPKTTERFLIKAILEFIILISIISMLSLLIGILFKAIVIATN